MLWSEVDVQRRARVCFCGWVSAVHQRSSSGGGADRLLAPRTTLRKDAGAADLNRLPVQEKGSQRKAEIARCSHGGRSLSLDDAACHHSSPFRQDLTCHNNGLVQNCRKSVPSTRRGAGEGSLQSNRDRRASGQTGRRRDQATCRRNPDGLTFTRKRQLVCFLSWIRGRVGLGYNRDAGLATTTCRHC